MDRDLARPETQTSLIALSQTVNPLTDNRRQESSSCLQSLEFWPAGSGPHGPPQAAHPAHPSQQIIILKTIPLECYHLGAFHLVFALLFLILCGLQGRLIFKVPAVHGSHLDPSSQVLFHLALAVALEVLHGAAEDAATALGIEAPGVVRAGLGQVARLLADEADRVAVGLLTLQLGLAVLGGVL